MRTGRARPKLACFLLTICFVCLVPRPGIAYEDLGLRLRSTIQDEPELQRGPRLARIDSLEAGWDGLDDDERERRRAEIVRLYSGSDLVKHRVWAAEMGEEHQDGASLARILAGARARERGWNPWGAQRLCRIACESFPDSARAHRELGRLLFDTAATTLDEEGVREARRAFVDAVRCPDAGIEDWRGLAGALLAERRYSEIGRCVPHLVQQPDPTVGELLLAAVGRMGEGLSEEAHQLFESAVRRMSTENQRLFLASDLGPAEDPNHAEWVDSLLRERGRSESTRLLWVRLVETELLFGRPESELHGWQTGPGSLYLRYGPPDDAYYDAPCPTGSCASLEEIVFALQVNHLRERVGAELVDRRPLDALWAWVYDIGGYRVPFFFTRPTVHYTWKASALSVDRAKLVSAKLPILLDPLEEDRELDLAIEHAAFRTPDDRIRAEAVFAIARDENAVGLSDSFRVSFSILDRDGELLEKKTRILEESHRRAAILAPWGEADDGDRAVVGQLAVELPPDEYLMRVEVEDMVTGAYRAHDRRFELQPATRLFGMSDLQLCDLFAELRPGIVVPEEFVKHAHVVIPHPERRTREGQESVYVYFEVYGAFTDARGQAHLDTIYELWREKEFHPSDAGLPRGQRGSHNPVIRADFPDERIGQTASGVVVKGTRFPLDELEPGDYVIAVLVSDRLAHDEARRFLPVSFISR